MNKLLENTRVLQAGLLALSEAQLQALLDEEMSSNKPRKLIIERIHQRIGILRMKRERKALFKEAGIQ